jgi:hypothetical protein
VKPRSKVVNHFSYFFGASVFLFKSAKCLPLITVAIVSFSCSLAKSDSSWSEGWKWGVKVGLGGTGIVKTAIVDLEELQVSRSEGPIVFGLAIERVLTDKLTFALEHHRGFRLGPFSMGIGFTSAVWRWYYLGVVPELVDVSAGDTIFTPLWGAFLGGSAGLALGSASREGEIVNEIDGSGAIIGMAIGADYYYSPQRLMRFEIFSSSTFFTSGSLAASMSEFGLMVGTFFPF